MLTINLFITLYKQKYFKMKTIQLNHFEFPKILNSE